VLLLFLLAGNPVGAGEFWQEKDYRRWSEKECRKLLENSPWATRYILDRVIIEQVFPPQLESTERGREGHPQVEYQVQFRSARPIRQALARLAQINQKYDQMPPEQQQAFDRKAEEFLAASFPDTVILHVGYSSNVQVDDRDLARHWQIQTTEMLKNFVYLIGSEGEKVPLLRYTVAEGGPGSFNWSFHASMRVAHWSALRTSR